MTKPETKETKLKPTRPPVVVILGHVDHGKTSILDYIRKTKVTERESGGITQHIGAYQVEHQNKKITFIDTPGHEMFSAMRARGAKVADIAVLVVAAEEGVKPQTKEAIKHIQETDLPFIVAINKIDKTQAIPEKVKKNLTENNVIVESLGGKVPSVNTSAKTGQGIDELLDMINLVAEMEELVAEEDKAASGIVIESNLSQKRGVTATVLVKEGTLRNTDVLGTNSAFARIKIMEDFRGENIDKALPSTPVIITGFNQPPKVGEEFEVFASAKEAQANIAPQSQVPFGIIRKEESADKKNLNMILRADVAGSLEAIEETIKGIESEEVELKIVKAGIGAISDSDVKLAQSTNAKIIGFKVKVPASVKRLAQQKKIRIFTFDVVYELIQGVKDLTAKLFTPEIIENTIGQLKILAIFRTEKDRQIIGGKVISGMVKKGALIKVLREGEEIGRGRIVQLQRGKSDADEVNKDQECGILFKGDVTLEEKDVLEFYEEERKRKEL